MANVASPSRACAATTRSPDRSANATARRPHASAVRRSPEPAIHFRRPFAHARLVDGVQLQRQDPLRPRDRQGEGAPVVQPFLYRAPGRHREIRSPQVDGCLQGGPEVGMLQTVARQRLPVGIAAALSGRRPQTRTVQTPRRGATARPADRTPSTPGSPGCFHTSPGASRTFPPASTPLASSGHATIAIARARAPGTDRAPLAPHQGETHPDIPSAAPATRVRTRM